MTLHTDELVFRLRVLLTRVFLLVLIAALALTACRSATAPNHPGHSSPASARNNSGGINRPEHRDKPHVVLISFDGFRPDYLDKFDLPNFRRVLARGVRADAMIPVYPSLTFPNHYSLVTGLYADRHGIVANSFYDPERRETYSLSNRRAVSDGSWYRGEPIWVTAETQGMVAAAFFWPGSEAPIKGVQPTYWKPYESAVPNEDRVNGVLEWLRLPDERRPHLITLYFSELDSASHRGPLDSPAVERAARSLDRSLGRLLDGIDGLPIRDRVFVVLTSDHGIVETSGKQTIRLESLIESGRIQTGFGGPVANLHVKGGRAQAQQVRDALNARLTHGRAYLREEVPERYQYKRDPRIGDVLVDMEESWTLATTPTLRLSERWGMHGWDPELPSMHALFVVSGPGIRAGARIDRVRNVDVYPFLAEILDLKAAASIDGQAGRIRAMVNADERQPLAAIR